MPNSPGLPPQEDFPQTMPPVYSANLLEPGQIVQHPELDPFAAHVLQSPESLQAEITKLRAENSELHKRLDDSLAANEDLISEIIRLAPTADRAEDAAIESAVAKAESKMFQESYGNLKEKAKYDSKTGALTEPALKEWLADYLEQNPDAELGLIFIDLGNFKKANIKGQADGDRVLRLLAERFGREGDAIARDGEAADEFVAIVDLKKRTLLGIDSTSEKTEGATAARDSETIAQHDDITTQTDSAEQTPGTELADEERRQQTLDAELERVRDIRSIFITEFPHMDEGTVRIFVGAGGVVYDKTASYQANRVAAEVAMKIQKKADHEVYGQYRVEEEA